MFCVVISKLFFIIDMFFLCYNVEWANFLCIQWLSRQTIKLRRENIVRDLKTCRGKRNVDLQI